MTFHPKIPLTMRLPLKAAARFLGRGMVDSTSAGYELPAYTALYGQLGDEEIVIRPSGEPEMMPKSRKIPQVQEVPQNRQRRRTIQWKSLRQNP